MEANAQPVLASPTEPCAAPGDGAPDWTSARDLHCPLCGYNLRGLTEPRCPECGYQFKWAELLDERLKVHPYLFEHHPERNTWSFLKTLTGGLRPARFWRMLHPGQTVRPGRLLAYWLTVAVVIGIAGAGAALAVGTVLTNASFAAEWGGAFFRSGGQTFYYWPDGTTRGTPPPVPPHFGKYGWDRSWRGFGQDYVNAAAAACAWPWVTLLTLMIFQASMRRAKVRPGHVRRCVLYSADAFLWAALCLLALAAMAMLGWMSGSAPRMYHAPAACLLAAGWGVATYRLGRAYGQYLQFDRPWATVIASQVIVGLLGLILLLQLALDRIVFKWQIL